MICVTIWDKENTLQKKKLVIGSLSIGFIIACTVLGLEYIHTKGVMHRDVKPENLVIDKNGYICLTDLGIARVLSPDNASDTSGTPGYMAPEVIFRQNHGVAVDYFALGVLAYECMRGIVRLSITTRDLIEGKIGKR